MVTEGARKFDYAMEYIYSHANTIIQAHDRLGVPIESAIESAARKALNRSASDDHQLKLIDEAGRPTE